MAWVRPKHPKRKQVDVDPTESLRPLLEFFSCSRPSASHSNSKELIRMPKKPLLLHDSYRPRPQTRYHEEREHHERPDHRLRGADPHRRAEHHQREDHHMVDDDRADYRERASQRTTSHYTREMSPPPPPPPPISSYRSNARPGAHLRLMPSRHHVAADTYTLRRPVSKWASATTPLEM